MAQAVSRKITMSSQEKIHEVIKNECLLQGFSEEALQYGCNYGASLYKNGKDFTASIQAGIVIAEGQQHRIRLSKS